MEARRSGTVAVALSVFCWIVLGFEEIGALIYGAEPILPSRLFRLILTGVLALTVYAIVRSAPHRVVLAPVATKEKIEGEPSTGDLAFGLGRQFERERSAINGHHLRAVSDRQN